MFKQNSKNTHNLSTDETKLKKVNHIYKYML